LNEDTINHIVGRMNRYSPLKPGGKWVGLEKLHNSYDLSLDEIFYLLGVVYERVKQQEETTKGKHSKVPTGAVGSQVFDRRSVKYWVHKQDLPFIIARVIQHLPLSTVRDTYAEAKENNIHFNLGQRISSVYLENTNFLYYHRRLERLEGSTLIRLRWYTDSMETDRNKLAPDSSVFMEMKVHHEAWSGDRSTKRRFAIKEKDVDAYLRGQLNLDPVVEKLRKKNTSEKEIDKFKSLAAEILGKVQAYNLQPALRSECTRAAFQRGQDQSVRVSIDTELRLSAEDFGLGHHWRVNNNEEQPYSDFPYAVVEIKLQCAENERIAPWIEELMQCRFMESVPKFSKYAHGIAALYGHTHRIRIVPYWLHQLHFDIRAACKAEKDQWDPTLGLAAGCFQRSADRVIFGVGQAQTSKIGASQASFLTAENYDKIYFQLLRGRGGHRSNLPPKIVHNVDRRHDAYTAFHLYPYSQDGVESLCFTPAASKNAAAHAYHADIPWQIGKRIKVPQKFDPKTLLTSERYMVKWVEQGAQLGIGGILAINFGYSHDLPLSIAGASSFWRSQFHVVVGVTLVVIGLTVCIYALITFRARTLRVYARKKIRYDDVNGPTFLTIFLACSLLATVANRVALRYGPMITGSDNF
jgi:hypothetical protein